MADTLSVRLSGVEREALSRAANAQGLGPSSLARIIIRRYLELDQTDDRWDDHERRISRLEEMAGL